MSFPIIAPSQYMHYLIVLILYVSDIDQTEDRFRVLHCVEEMNALLMHKHKKIPLYKYSIIYTTSSTNQKYYINTAHDR